MKPNPVLVAALARSFVAGEQSLDEVVSRGVETLGRRWRWLGPVARRYVERFGGGTRPRQRAVVEFLLRDLGFARACATHSDKLRVANRLVAMSEMQPVEAGREWNVPAIESVGKLADWFGLSVGELEWFADLKGLGRAGRGSSELQHYHYRVFAKRSGIPRLIESPKSRLKELQRQILSLILNRVPSHMAAHGFVKGRSTKTFAAPHVGRRVVLRIDLQDFFPSIRAPRIQTLFRTMGYPEGVADLLGGLCTNAAPPWIWEGVKVQLGKSAAREMREMYGWSHLPQGTPTSPALANICAYRLDCRLAGLATVARGTYTRYADDLAFSGDEDFERGVERFATRVGAVLSEEGFTANFRKTRMMKRGVRQHLAGLVVNQQVGVKRDHFDRLKALLTNCVRKGPESQNHERHPSFQAHLAGRVGYVEMIRPERGRRLRELFDRIEWQ